jgi:hypothetical protein
MSCKNFFPALPTPRTVSYGVVQCRIWTFLFFFSCLSNLFCYFRHFNDCMYIGLFAVVFAFIAPSWHWMIADPFSSAFSSAPQPTFFFSYSCYSSVCSCRHSSEPPVTCSFCPSSWNINMDATRKSLNTETQRLASWPQDVVRNFRRVVVHWEKV